MKEQYIFHSFVYFYLKKQTSFTQFRKLSVYFHKGDTITNKCYKCSINAYDKDRRMDVAIL